jgi:hypothetical protein
VRIDGPSLQLAVRDLQVDERGLSQFSASISPEIKPHIAYVWHRDQVYELSHAGDALSIMDRGRPGISFLNSFEDYWTAANSRWQDQDDERNRMQIFHGLARNLIGNSFRMQSQVHPEDVSLPENVVRVFVYAPAPAAFQVQGERFPDQIGFVMYVVDLPVGPEGGAAVPQ